MIDAIDFNKHVPEPTPVAAIIEKPVVVPVIEPVVPVKDGKDLYFLAGALVVAGLAYKLLK